MHMPGLAPPRREQRFKFQSKVCGNMKSLVCLAIYLAVGNDALRTCTSRQGLTPNDQLKVQDPGSLPLGMGA